MRTDAVDNDVGVADTNSRPDTKLGGTDLEAVAIQHPSSSPSMFADTRPVRAGA